MRAQTWVGLAVLGVGALAGRAAAQPNDPLWADEGAFGQWNLMGSPHPDYPDAGVRGIDAEGAWSLTEGRPDVVIAILDSGVELDHPDLAANIALSAAECEAAGVADADGDGVLLLAEAESALGDLDGDGIFTALDAIEGCENGVDDDENGYVDDIAGWDFEDDDNVPMDNYGHGTGRASIAAAVANNEVGMVGVCPGCRILPVRLGRTFVATPDKLAQALAYAGDVRAAAAVMANASLGNSATLRAAVDYADRRGVVLCASIGNEGSRHHHFPQSYENVIAVAGLTYAEKNAPGDFGAYWAGSNFGAHVGLAAPTFVWAAGLDGTYSEEGGTSSSSPHCAGAAGLVVSRARDLGLSLSARQVRSILFATADGAPDFSLQTGAGRLNARAAVAAVDAASIPPDARIVSPRWYHYLPPGTIEVDVAAGADDAITLEFGYGAAPEAWTPIEGTRFEPSPPEPEAGNDERGDAYAVTLRLTAVAPSGATAIDRRTFFVHSDPDAVPGFPVDLGSSSEGGPLLVDLDGDNRLEILIATDDGRVHALRGDGAEAPGWPVSLGPPPTVHLGSRAHAAGGVPTCCSALFSGLSAGDLDGDGLPEVVAGGLDGRLYAWRPDGTPIEALSRDVGAAVWAAPVLADLDGDGALDVIVATMARRVLALASDGEALAGWPVEVGDPSADAVVGGLVATPAAGDIDGDGTVEVIIATTETESEDHFSRGRVYAFRSDGEPLPGFPVRPFGLMTETFPIVGSGVATHPVIADLDGDGRAEILVAHAAGQITAFRDDGTVATPFDHGELVDGFSPFGPDKDSADPRWEMNLALLGQTTVVDLTNDDVPEIILGTMAMQKVDIFQLAADPGEALAMLRSVLTLWRADGTMRELFPLELDGWTLFAGATVADLDSDTLPEVLVPTDGGRVQAFDALGEAPPAFPKFTGGWTGPGATVGDLDADGYLDVVTNTREGAIFAWKTGGKACVNGAPATRWGSLHHDAHNSAALTTDAAGPAAVADARVEDGKLVFTAVGDDGFAGAASRYDARWSMQAITTAEAFDAATPVEVSDHPRVGRTVRAGKDLPEGAHAAVVAYDEAGNRSPLPAPDAAPVPDRPCVTADVIRPDDPDRGGCGCRAGARASHGGAVLLLLAVAALLGRRRDTC